MRRLLTIGLPLIGSLVAQILIQTTDTVMLGWYDVDALAGLVLGGSLFVVLFLVLSGFSFAVTPLVAEAEVQGDAQGLRRTARMGLWLSLLGGVLGLPILWFSGELFAALRQDPVVSENAQTYLRIAGWGMLPGLGVMVLKAYLSALERTAVQLFVTLGAALLNAALNWVLIFGNLGAPELGIRGAAISSVVLQSASFLALILYARRSFPEHDLFARLWRPDFGAMRRIFSMGWHIGLTMLAEVGLFSGSAIIVGWVGKDVLAAHGIALQVVTLTFMIQLGLSQAVTVRAGRAYGENDIAGLRRGLAAAHVLGGAVAVLVALAYLLFPGAIIGVFLDPADPASDEIIRIGAALLIMGGVFQLVDASQVLTISALRGMQDTRVPMILAAFAYWGVGAPAAYVLALPLGFGGQGVWAGLVIGLAVAAIVMMIRFRQQTRR